MSVLDYLRGRLERGVITFINAVIGANRDYPYHDFHTDTMTSAYQLYNVGDNNVGLSGDQHKRFVSKLTPIFVTQNAYIKLNHANNVVITLLANTWYNFKVNIHAIHYRYVDTEGTIYIIAGGVAPNEARRPE